MIPASAAAIRTRRRRAKPKPANVDALRELILPEPAVIWDRREQLPYKIPGAIPGTLSEGDYSATDLLDVLRIERKSHIDLAGSCGSQSERFERELQRLVKYRWKFIMIEASLDAVLHRPPEHSHMSPVAIVARLLQWNIRYGVVPVFAGSRRHAQYMTVRLIRAARRELEREREAVTWP